MKFNFNDIEFSLQEKSGFFNSMSSLYEAGIPMGSLFSLMAEETNNIKIKTVCTYIAGRVESGETLEKAAAPFKKTLGEAYTALLTAGEASGKLENILSNICSNISKQQEIRSGLINALIYPACILTFALGVSMLFMFFILPSFKSIGSDTSVNTGALFISAVIKIVLVYAALFGFVIYAAKNTNLKRKIRQLISKLPVIKEILKNYYFAAFFYIMSSAYEAGIPAANTVMLGASIIGIEEAAQKIKLAAKKAERGMNIAQTLNMTGLFTGYAVSQIKAGEESGRLDKTLQTAAKDYERRMDDAVKIMVKLSGPIVILICGIITGILAYKMYSEYYKAIFSML